MNPKSKLLFYTVSDVADMLSVSQRSIRRWIAAGEISVHKWGRQVRILEADLNAFLEMHKA